MTHSGETAADDGFASYCSRYPRLSLAVIVVLLVAVLYLLAERYGWLGLGQKAEPLVPQMRTARGKCLDADGAYKDDMYSMFISWALLGALENCGAE